MKSTQRSNAVLVALAAAAIAACGGTPSTPTRTDVPSTSASSPAPEPPRVQPTIAAVVPDAVWTGGGGWGTITGDGFEAGAKLTLGAERVFGFVQDSTRIIFLTTAQPAGVVDVTVENPGGLTSRLEHAFSYVPSDGFELDGVWSGHVGSDYEIDMPFTVQHHTLVSLSCGTTQIVAAPLSVSFKDGEFVATGDDRLRLSGRMVAPTEAAGEISSASCPASGWWADRRIGP